MSQARRKFETVCAARAVIAAQRVAEYNFAPLRAGRVLSEFRSKLWSECRSSIRSEMHIGRMGNGFEAEERLCAFAARCDRDSARRIRRRDKFCRDACAQD